MQLDQTEIKNEFIEILKDYTNFNGLEKLEKIEVAKDVLEKVFDKTKTYVDSNQKEKILESILKSLIFGLRQIQDIYDDANIEEIMINGREGVYIKNRFNDKIVKTDIKFESEDEITTIIEKLLDGTNRRVDKSNPMVDIRLKDGHRANIVLPPVAKNGAVVTIRKFPEKSITLEDLVESGTINKSLQEFLVKTVKSKANILIVGGTGSGKTTTLNAIAGNINEAERVVVIEETSEITLSSVDNAIYLETRLDNLEGKGAISIRSLLKNSLRMRPNRIIVGEVRGEEAFDMVQAMNTGHPGSFTTLHANSCSDAIERLTAMLMLSGFSQLSLETIKTWIKSSIDLIIWQKQSEDGVRRIMEVSTIDKSLETVKLFEFKGKKGYLINKKAIDGFFKSLAVNRN